MFCLFILQWFNENAEIVIAFVFFGSSSLKSEIFFNIMRYLCCPRTVDCFLFLINVVCTQPPMRGMSGAQQGVLMTQALQMQQQSKVSSRFLAVVAALLLLSSLKVDVVATSSQPANFPKVVVCVVCAADMLVVEGNVYILVLSQVISSHWMIKGWWLCSSCSLKQCQ